MFSYEFFIALFNVSNRVVELEEQIKREKDQADLLLEQQRLVRTQLYNDMTDYRTSTRFDQQVFNEILRKYISWEASFECL